MQNIFTTYSSVENSVDRQNLLDLTVCCLIPDKMLRKLLRYMLKTKFHYLVGTVNTKMKMRRHGFDSYRKLSDILPSQANGSPSCRRSLPPGRHHNATYRQVGFNSKLQFTVKNRCYWDKNVYSYIKRYQ